MNPYLSWAILLFVAGGLGLYYRKDTSPRGRAGPAKPVHDKTEHAPANKKIKRKTKKPADNSGSDAAAAAVTVKQQETAKPATQPGATPSNGAPKGDIDNYEFARQFSKARNGDIITGKAKASAKAPRAQAPKPATRPLNGGRGDVEHESSASISASSTAGADADDDLSPISSPATKPKASAADDISDMLEAPQPAAGVLRLTGSLEDQTKKKKRTDTFKSVETKKQRQARIKRENNRQMVEEAEAERKNLLEKQLHASRSHERREKTKSKSKPQTPNAWASDTPTQAQAANGVSKPSAMLLDTFEPASQPTKPVESENIPPSSNQAASGKKGSAASNSAVKNWADNLPSEEEQMRMLSAMSSENEWTTVSSRKKEKRQPTISDTSSEAPQTL